MWNSCIFTQFCLCMCMELFHSSWSTLGTCVQKIHLYIYKYVRRDLNFFFNIILLEKLLLQKNILYIYFMDIIFSYTLIWLHLKIWTLDLKSCLLYIYIYISLYYSASKISIRFSLILNFFFFTISTYFCFLYSNSDD